MLRMADSTTPANLPPGYDAYAGYVDGHWPDVQAIAAAEGGKPVLSISVFASDDADCLDIENGDATPAQAATWAIRQHTRGVARPGLYASVAANMPAVVAMLSSAGLGRSSVRLWSAHYLSPLEAHICGPDTCKLIGEPMDGTQWTNTAPGVGSSQIDASLLLDNFFQEGIPVESTVQAQSGFVVCSKCYALYPAGNASQSVCPAGGQHSTPAGWDNYSLLVAG